MEQQIQLNDHNKQEYPPYAHCGAFIECHYGEDIRLSTLT